MPRLWAQQCRVNPAHTGPFSRNGLCPPCRHALLREAGKIGSKLGGGRPREYTYNVPRSWQPLTRRVKHASIKQKQRDTASTKERKVSRIARQKQGGQHRSCFRCRKRLLFYFILHPLSAPATAAAIREWVRRIAHQLNHSLDRSPDRREKREERRF